MIPGELQEYLHSHIPISKAMGVTAELADLKEVVLKAPLGPNINHRETVFGGSVSALAMLAGWSLMRLRLGNEDLNCRIVIHSSAMEFTKPVETDFRARAVLSDPGEWEKFLSRLRRRGMSRITVSAVLDTGGEALARFTGSFAAVMKGGQ